MRTSGGILDDRFVFMMLPGFSLLLLFSGLLGLIMPGVGGALGYFGYLLAAACVAGLIFGVYLTFAGLGSSPVPEWALPKWAKKN